MTYKFNQQNQLSYSRYNYKFLFSQINDLLCIKLEAANICNENNAKRINLHSGSTEHFGKPIDSN